MNVYAFFETRAFHAFSSIQTFVNIAQYEDEAYSKWNRQHVHHRLAHFDCVVIVAYLNFEEAKNDPETTIIEALERIRLIIKHGDVATAQWTSACPVSPGHTFSAFHTFNERPRPHNFRLEI